MEHKNFLIDTNIAIFYFGAALSTKAEAFIDKVVENTYYLSVVNRIELLGFRGLSQNETTAFQSFVKKAEVIDLEEDIILETIRLRKECQVKLPDAIIAATCIVIGLTLITNNVKDFQKIKGLKIHSV